LGSVLKLNAFLREPTAGEQLPMNALFSQRENTLSQTMVKTKPTEADAPDVGIIMGSISDWKTMRLIRETFHTFGIRNEPQVVSAHRSPDRMYQYATDAEERGFSLIIAGAGGAAHLPGMTAAITILPVIGVPVVTTPLKGLDAQLSIMQMPAEVGVATVSVGQKGAVHAALFAATILALRNPRLYPMLRARRDDFDLLGDVKPPASTLAQPSKQKVLILQGSGADHEFMRHSEEYLSKLDCPHATEVVELDTPVEELLQSTRAAEDKGTSVFIVGSGNGIQLARNVARATMLPVLAVPTIHETVQCLDTFLEPFLNMPSGVATFAVNRAGAVNAALFAANILSGAGSEVRNQLKQMQKEQRERVEEMDRELQELVAK
jgi:5-(carboxyamino)imidazole ribonucleotide mutase